jgi:hypothetical protein
MFAVRSLAQPGDQPFGGAARRRSLSAAMLPNPLEQNNDLCGDSWWGVAALSGSNCAKLVKMKSRLDEPESNTRCQKAQEIFGGNSK